jgi:CHRD domain
MRARVLAVCVLALACLTPLAVAALPGGTKTLTTSMAGSNEVPPGAPQGSGKAVIVLSTKLGRVCWTFAALKGLDTVTASHIHLAPKGKSGNIVVPFFAGALKTHGCVKAPASTISAIEKNPSNYYVNIHTMKYPAGAIRGQL